MKSYPTKHANINFRSRLEAKWAAFFDLLGWSWDYEPVDFFGWIPDFAIYGKRHLTYVEIKPVRVFPESVSTKIDCSGCDDEILICGISPKVVSSVYTENEHACIGWLDDKDFGWSAAPISMWKNSFGFCHDIGSYRDRVSGMNTGYPCGDSEFEEDVKSEILKLWADATNSVQWKKVKNED